MQRIQKIHLFQKKKKWQIGNQITFFYYKHNGYKHIQAQICGNLKHMQIEKFLSSKNQMLSLWHLSYSRTRYIKE